MEYLPAGRFVNANLPSSLVMTDFVSRWSRTLAIVTRACASGAPETELTTLPAMRKPPPGSLGVCLR